MIFYIGIARHRGAVRLRPIFALRPSTVTSFSPIRLLTHRLVVRPLTTPVPALELLFLVAQGVALSVSMLDAMEGS